MRRSLLLCLVIASMSAQSAEPGCPIVPTPKVSKDSGHTAELLAPEACAIVVAAKATEPERYAAERLQGLIERRFDRKLPILPQARLRQQVRQVILLGQRAPDGWIDMLCKRHRIDLSDRSPGHDGFVIETVADPTRDVILIGGSTARGVIYGADALFDLLRRDGDKVVFPVVSIRDWPSIPWRGRPISRPEAHLEPGTFDAYVRARMNWVDLRDGPPPRRGQFGIPPGFDFDKDRARKILAEAHRRGFFVYGTVFCGVKPGQFDAVLAKFQETLDLGVDGLWVSFDDPGPGSNAPELIRRVLALGKQHGMTGRQIMTVPPTGSYQHIDTGFNRSVVAAPGFESATWMFTRVPCAADLAATRKLGLKRLPGWWHNWPRTTGGFLHDSYGGSSLRPDGRRAYLDVPPLTVGWHSPRYERLRDGEKHTDTVMLWGGWPEEYVCSVLSLWAWDPKGHNWARTRQSIYSWVFGSAQADAAGGFDDKLAALKGLFELPVRRTRPRRGWPPRLKRLDDRAKALELLGEMDALLKTLEAKAPAETMIEAARLQRLFLEPMRATVSYARAMAQLDYPDYALGDLDERMVGLLIAGQEQQAERTLAAAREQATRRADEVAKALKGLKGIDDYARLWRTRVAGLDHWRKLAARRQAEMQKVFKQVVVGDYAALLAKSAQSPPGQPLAELAPADWLKAPMRWRGTWGIGLHEAGGRQAVAIAYPRKTPSKPGDYAEIAAEVATPAFKGRLVLQAFVNDTHVTDQWTGYRFLQLWANDRLAWEEDIALSREGKEWIAADITDAAKDAKSLRLRFRVVDRRAVSNYPDITVLGPVRLVQR